MIPAVFLKLICMSITMTSIVFWGILVLPTKFIVLLKRIPTIIIAAHVFSGQKHKVISKTPCEIIQVDMHNLRQPWCQTSISCGYIVSTLLPKCWGCFACLASTRDLLDITSNAPVKWCCIRILNFNH